MSNLYKAFSAKEAAKFAGFDTPAMVIYLRKEGIIQASHRDLKTKGKKLLFTFRDVLILKIVSKLLSRGITVKKIKDALKKSADLKSLKTDMAKLDCYQRPIKYFFTDGKDVFFVRDIGAEITNLSKNGQLEFAFILDVEEIHKNLVSEINKAKKVA